MQTDQQLAPAKVNLTLRVLGRRSDGYHELDSLFVPLALADLVELQVEEGTTPEASVSCTCPGHPELEGAENLASRAATAYLAASGRRARIQIRLEKRIWIAAGLGGGSSDAAAVLRGLERLLGPLPPGQLQATARGLGADVPYFLDPRPARVRGTGERITPLPGFPSLELVLLNPGRGLSTAAVYAGLSLAPGQQHRPAVELPPLSSVGAIAGHVGNDLASAAERLCPEIAAMRMALIEAGAEAAALSGSGPTVFGVYRTPQAASAAAEKVRMTTQFLVQRTVTAGA